MVPPVSRTPRSRPGGGPTVVLLPALYSDSQVAASRLDLVIASGSTPTPEPRAGSGLWRGGGFLAALVATVCLVAGCGSSMPTVTPCIDSVPGAGDLRARHRYPVTCPTASPELTAKASPSEEAPDGPPDKVGADEPDNSVSPQTDESRPSIPGPTPPPASLAVGEKSSAGAGTYVLWTKAENHVYLVEDGVVKRAMLTTAEPWKTPVGDYEIEYKVQHAASTEDGIRWYIPNFLAFYQRPGAIGHIGFHQIPWDEKTKKPAQPVYTLGMPGYSSHGCARLAPKDSEALYNFAHEGTKVKVR